MVARMAALSFRERALCSALILESAARKRYACCSEWVTCGVAEESTHVVDVLYGEAVAFHPADAVDEEGAGCAHEAACGGCREGVFEGAEEGMGVERGRGVWRGRAGGDGRACLVMLETDEDAPARSTHQGTSAFRSDAVG